MNDPTPARSTSRLLIDEPPLVIQPSLACAVGLNEALILQQVHYWLGRSAIGKDHDGRHWVKMTHEDWLEQLPFLGRDALMRAIKNIKTKGVLLTCRDLGDSSWDRSTWYSIDYAVLDAIDIPKRETVSRKRTANNGNGAKHDAVPSSGNHTMHDRQTVPSSVSKPDDPSSGDLTISYTETTSETTSETLSPVANAPVESAPVADPPDVVAMRAVLQETMTQQERAEHEPQKEPPAEVKEVLPPPPALGLPPDGFVWIESSVSTLQGTAHLAPRDAKLPHALCKTHLKHIGMTHTTSAPCAACVALAAKPKRAPKPAIYSDAALYDAIGAFSFGGGDAADLAPHRTRIGVIRKALADYICAKLGRAPDANEVAAVVANVVAMPCEYRSKYKDREVPKGASTFMDAYKELFKNGNGAGNGKEWIYRGKAWPVHDGRVHVEIEPGVFRNIPAADDNWQSFLRERNEEDKRRGRTN